jgi:hypothetical protein
MKCISCEIEVNPKWKHAIDRNICPFCGQSIMEELLKGLLSTLQDTMEKLQSYSDQVDDWLLSNYNYVKTDDPALVSYVPQEVLKELLKALRKDLDQDDFERKKTTIKVKIDDEEKEVVTEKIQSNSRTAGFFERAEIIKKGSVDGDGDGDGDGNEVVDTSEREVVQLGSAKPAKPKSFKSAAERTKYLKELKAKIEEEGKSGVISQKGLATMMATTEGADAEDVAAFQSAIGGGDIVNSALSSPATLDDEDRMAERVLSMNLKAASRGNNNAKGHDGGYNQKDAQALQNLVDKAQGTNMGGGFSRS